MTYCVCILTVKVRTSILLHNYSLVCELATTVYNLSQMTATLNRLEIIKTMPKLTNKRQRQLFILIPGRFDNFVQSLTQSKVFLDLTKINLA